MGDPVLKYEQWVDVEQYYRWAKNLPQMTSIELMGIPDKNGGKMPPLSAMPAIPRQQNEGSLGQAARGDGMSQSVELGGNVPMLPAFGMPPGLCGNQLPCPAQEAGGGHSCNQTGAQSSNQWSWDQPRQQGVNPGPEGARPQAFAFQ